MIREELIDFSRYELFEDGNIYSKWFKKILKQKQMKNGYYKVNLKCKDGLKRDFLKHRVIAYYFIPNPDNKSEVDHIKPVSEGGGDNVSNLRWATSSENSRNEITLQKNINSQPKNAVYAYLNGKLYGFWESENAAARDLNINQGNIHNCATGKCKTYKGYEWSYEPL